MWFVILKVSDITDGKDEAVNKAIQAAIDTANAKSESRAKKIAKFTILPQDFSIPGGELGNITPPFTSYATSGFSCHYCVSCLSGPTLKLKRPVATKKHESLIESMYEE